MRKIGIFGGTFNPVHIGHLSVAQTALEKLDLDAVIFVPSHTPPHKSGKGVVDAKHRLNMVKLAVKDNPRFDVTDFEVKRKGKSYSIDTVRYLKEIFGKKTKFFFIVGGDALNTLHLWKSIDELLKLITFVVVNRAGIAEGKSKVKFKKITMPGLEVSSTLLRESLASSKTGRYLLPKNVFNYIKKNKLYQ